MIRIGAALVLLPVLTCGPVYGQEPSPAGPQAPQEQIEPDRPDITNSAHLVPVGVLQFEMGGLFYRPSSQAHSSATPFSVRYGVTPWLEARADGDGFLSNTDETGTERGMGNVQLGAKVRLVSDAEGAGLLALEPEVTIPVASARKGLGSGRSDLDVAVLTGTDFLKRGHIDVNYAIGSIGADGGRFTQNAASASTSVGLGNLSPYVELFWFSREGTDTGRVVGIDGGAIYVITPHLAIDGGMQAGLSDALPGFSAFGGLSFNVGPRSRRHVGRAAR